MKFKTLPLMSLCVASTSQVRTMAMLVLLVTWCCEVPRWEDIQWHDIHTAFHENLSISAYIVDFWMWNRWWTDN